VMSMLRVLLASILFTIVLGAGLQGPYTVKGNKVYDKNNQVHTFLGVDRCSLEWCATGVNISLYDFQQQASWGSTVVRVPLDQDFWLVGAKNYSAGYINTIQQAVSWAHQAGLDVILDLHWSDMGNLQNNPGQQRMADQNSLTFWSAVADLFKNDPNVLFEMYNEPNTIDWDVWLNGGDSGQGWTAVGMQQIYNTIRATGAQQICIAGGLNWAFDLSQVLQYPIQGNNIMYNTHPYDYPGKQPENWDAAFGYLTDTYPVIATEFGDMNCTEWYYEEFINYAAEHQMHWTAWAWFPGGCLFPALILNWEYAPNVAGSVVKQALGNQANQQAVIA